MKQCPLCKSEMKEQLLFCPFDGQTLIPVDQADKFIGIILDDKYRIDEKVGEGGMGKVYRATHILMDHTVAVKILHPHLSSDQVAVERFRREARAAASIRHPSAVAVTDFGVNRETGLSYLVMEFLEGVELRDVIKKKRQLGFEESYIITQQICSALQAAHARGIIHRDLKPDNIWLLKSEDDFPRVKVLDFGIAKLKEANVSNLTQQGMIVGTPYYMSPEQCLGDELDARSDIYSLGIIIYEILTGQVPFQGSTPMGVVLKHANEPPMPPHELRSDLPYAIENVVLRALSKHREDRQGSAMELAQEFESALYQAGVELKFLDANALQDSYTLSSYPYRSRDATVPQRTDGRTAPPRSMPSEQDLTVETTDWSKSLSVTVIPTLIGLIGRAKGLIKTILNYFLRREASDQRNTTVSPESCAVPLGHQTVHIRVDDLISQQGETPPRDTVVLRYPAAFRSHDEHVFEQLILHKDYERLVRSLVYAGGGRNLLTGYGPFGGTSLVRCAIAKAREELKRAGEDKGALLAFYFQITKETKRGFDIQAATFRFDSLEKPSDPDYDADLQELRARSARDKPEFETSAMDFKLDSPLDAAFFTSPRTITAPQANQEYGDFSHFIADLNAFFRERRSSKALRAIVLRLLKSEFLPSRVVFILDRIQRLETLESLFKSELFSNSRIRVIAVARKEDFDCWKRAEVRLKTIGFSKWYVPCLWKVHWDRSLFNSVTGEKPEFEKLYRTFLRHLVFVGRGSVGNIIGELKQPTNTSYGGDFDYIDVVSLAERAEVQHNAWIQKVLDLNWVTILGDRFGGRNQDERTDRARIGMYCLLDWMSHKPRFNIQDAIEESLNTPISISDDLQTTIESIQSLLYVLIENRYLRFQHGQYCVVWNKDKQPKCREVGPLYQRTFLFRRWRVPAELHSERILIPSTQVLDAPSPDSPRSVAQAASPTTYLPDLGSGGTPIVAPPRTQMTLVSRQVPPTTTLELTLQNAPQRNKIFVSYCHADRVWLERLRVHLMPLEREGKIELWDDTKIKAGARWKEQISQAVSSAKVAILLISANFLASDFIANNELPPLLIASEREGTIIIPVIVRPCLFMQTALSQFQAINASATPLTAMNKNQQEKVLMNLAESIGKLLSS